MLFQTHSLERRIEPGQEYFSKLHIGISLRSSEIHVALHPAIPNGATPSFSAQALRPNQPAAPRLSRM